MFLAKVVPGSIEGLERLGISNSLVDDVTSHDASRLLGEKRNHLVLTVLKILELRRNDVSVQGFWFHRLEVLIGSQINQDVSIRRGQVFVEGIRHAITPEFIEVLAALVCKLKPHLKSIWLHGSKGRSRP